jgi:cytochrome P450
MTADMVDEILYRTEEVFGANPDAVHECVLQEALSTILLGVTNRAIAGKQLARSDDYTRTVKDFIAALPRQAVKMDSLTPTLLKPFLAPLLAREPRRLSRAADAFLLPMVRKHLTDACAGEGSMHHEERHPDVIQLMARFAAKSSDARDHDARNLSSRLLALSFVGVHTSTAAAINGLVAILGAGPELWVALREEAVAALKASVGNVWSKATVARLPLLDSTLRESMRVMAFKGRGVEREVVAREGVTLPDGTFLSCGTKVGVPTIGIQLDERFYERPDEFIHDRFVGKAEMGMVNTTDTFLAFGHGRHAW